MLLEAGLWILVGPAGGVFEFGTGSDLWPDHREAQEPGVPVRITLLEAAPELDGCAGIVRDTDNETVRVPGALDLPDFGHH